MQWFLIREKLIIWYLKTLISVHGFSRGRPNGETFKNAFYVEIRDITQNIFKLNFARIKEINMQFY